MENNLPYVDFKVCENELKSLNLLNEDDSLYAVNTIFSNSTSSSLTTIFLNSEGDEVDTSLCDEFQVKSPSKIENLNLETYSTLKQELGIDIYNSTSEYFTDECFVLDSDVGVDIPISVRAKEFSDSISCESNCSYEGLDEAGYSICTCNQPPQGFQTETGKKSPIDFGLEGNFSLFKCYRNVFTKGLFKNAGFILFTSIFVFTGIGIVVNNLFLPVTKVVANYKESIIKNDFDDNIEVSNVKGLLIQNDSPNIIGNPNSIAGNDRKEMHLIKTVIFKKNSQFSKSSKVKKQFTKNNFLLNLNKKRNKAKTKSLKYCIKRLFTLYSKNSQFSSSLESDLRMKNSSKRFFRIVFLVNHQVLVQLQNKLN